MRYLLFSRFLFSLALFFPAMYVNGQAAMDNNQRGHLQFESIKFRAAVDVIGKHLSGILVFKQDTINHSIRTVFVNEMGVTFFDLTFFDDRYVFNTVLESMNKKAVKISLAKDIGMILMRGIFKKPDIVGSRFVATVDCKDRFILSLKRKGTVHYPCRPGTAAIEQIENFGRRKKVVTVSGFYDKNQIGRNTLPDSIFVQHHTVNFTISLKQLHAAE